MPRPHDPIRDVFLAMDPPEDLHGEYPRGRIVMVASTSVIHNRILVPIAQQAPEGYESLATQGIEFALISDLPEPDVVVVEAGAVAALAD